jgi:hypothetical protein
MFPFPTPTTFASKRGVLGLTLSTSSILDFILHLSNTITSTHTSITDAVTENITVQEIQSQAWEMNTRFTSLHQLPNDEIAQIILLTATYYTHAISTLTPFSNLLSPSQLYEIYNLIIAVPLSRWQEVPGIFLWVCFLSIPFPFPPFHFSSLSPTLSPSPSSPTSPRQNPTQPINTKLTIKTDPNNPLPQHKRRHPRPLDPSQNGHLRNSSRDEY